MVRVRSPQRMVKFYAMYLARKEKARKPVCIWSLIAYALVSATLCVQVSALNPDRKISQYAHTAWRVQDGYFNGPPTVFAQTADGYLWIGTRAGLMHFDGVRFVPWTPPPGKKLPSPFITSLLAGRDGSLWVGTSSGLARWKNGELVNVGLKAFIQRMYEDQNGTIWVTHTRGSESLGPVCQVRETKLRCYGKADGFPAPYADAIAGEFVDRGRELDCPLAARVIPHLQAGGGDAATNIFRNSGSRLDPGRKSLGRRGGAWYGTGTSTAGKRSLEAIYLPGIR